MEKFELQEVKKKQKYSDYGIKMKLRVMLMVQAQQLN